MLTVGHTIRALRREILAALAEDATLPMGASFSADRITLSLAVRIDPAQAAPEGSDPFRIAADPGPSDHRITVEFRLGEAAAPVAATAVPPMAAPSPESAKVVTPGGSAAFSGLAQIFGEPGFDSSARATVFREALDELDLAQRRQVLLGLGEAHSAGEDPAVDRARHLIHRLACAGPSGPAHGPRLLRALAAEFPTEELTALAATRWRTQSEWAAAAAERS